MVQPQPPLRRIEEVADVLPRRGQRSLELATGLAHALFLAHAHDRFLRTGLALLHQQQQPITTATRTYQKALDTLAVHAGLAA